jgi:hypothetical protein
MPVCSLAMDEVVVATDRNGMLICEQSRQLMRGWISPAERDERALESSFIFLEFQCCMHGLPVPLLNSVGSCFLRLFPVSWHDVDVKRR